MGTMPARKRRNWYWILAMVWSLAAISMLAGVVRQLPAPAPMSLVLLLTSAAAAVVWWFAFAKLSPNKKPKQHRGRKYDFRRTNSHE